MEAFAYMLGKNRILSIAELASHFHFNGIGFRVLENRQDFFIAESERPADANALGGLIKAAEIRNVIGRKELPGFLKHDSDMNLFFIKTDDSRLVFGVSIYPWSRKNIELHKRISLIIKKRLREEGLKAHYFNLPKDRCSLTHVEVIRQEIIEKSFEIVLLICDSRIYIGKTVGCHNPFEFQKRDVERPVVRSELSTSPRLSRILINLTGYRKGDKLIDPFCGTGTILQEAAVMGLDFYGLDLDKNMADAGRKNLYWISEKYKLNLENLHEKIKQGDARNSSDVFPNNGFDAIATEPYLGPLLKRRPDLNHAKGIIREIEPLYEAFLKEAHKILRPGGRISIVSPRFITEKGIVRLETERLAGKSGLQPFDILQLYKINHPHPLTDFEEGQFLGREIHIFEKAE
ncbi:MAG: methyltransferase domain-containing protein [Candidatus Aenigmarchaeota archaeon]|nr:methyltransferase domain-containing protein [Candidatus Aenigmarchaeota archaeon]